VHSRFALVHFAPSLRRLRSARTAFEPIATYKSDQKRRKRAVENKETEQLQQQLQQRQGEFNAITRACTKRVTTMGSRRHATPSPSSTSVVEATDGHASATEGERPHPSLSGAARAVDLSREGAPTTRRAATASHLPDEAAMTPDVDTALLPLHPTREAVRPGVPASKPSACAHVVASTGPNCEGAPIARRAATASHLPDEAAMTPDVDTALLPLHPTREAVRPGVPASKPSACAHVVASTDAMKQRR
jgi:hypothetical protein